jgi:hypothetical protein
VGRWEGDTLVVDTTGFNDKTWLNEEGAQHSDALHLVERIRPVLGGQYLEYKMNGRGFEDAGEAVQLYAVLQEARYRSAGRCLPGRAVTVLTCATSLSRRG